MVTMTATASAPKKKLEEIPGIKEAKKMVVGIVSIAPYLTLLTRQIPGCTHI